MAKTIPRVEKVRKKTSNFLDKIGLDSVVSAEEVEDEMSSADNLYDSPLMLGLIARCSEETKPDLLPGLIQLITDWKITIPRKDLGGLSVYEYEERNPRGQMELWIINKLFQSYESTLRSKASMFTPTDVSDDFAIYQKSFLDLIPASQPFSDVAITMTHRDIILEERKRSGNPQTTLKNLGTVVFTHEPSRNTLKRIQHFEDIYESSANDLSSIHAGAKPSVKALGKILSDLAGIEPFMKCTTTAPAFYGTFAGAAFLLKEYTLAEDLLRQSLSINPRFRPAKLMLERISSVKTKLD